MENYIDWTNGVWYRSSSCQDLVEHVLKVTTKDLKAELKARDETIARMQKKVENLEREFLGAEAVIAELRRMNDRQSDTITDYQTKTEVLYKENMILKMKNDIFVDENNDLNTENESLTRKNAQLTQDYEGLNHKYNAMRINTLIIRDLQGGLHQETYWHDKYVAQVDYCLNKCPRVPPK